MRNPGGYLHVFTPETTTEEHDTFTCHHCNAVVVCDAPPAPPKGGFCLQCMSKICDKCEARPWAAENGKCVPFEKRLEQIEQRGRMLAAIGV